MPRVHSVLCALLFGLLGFAASGRAAEQPFDFYVLSLSWSPTFCATAEEARGAAQCDAGARFGFIVHGLWPQYERGYPENCGTTRRLSRRVVDSALDIMPGAGLVRHEWRRHGSCSGLSPERYFALVRRAFAAIRLPSSLSGSAERTVSSAAIEATFVSANPGMRRDGIAISCRDGYLEEVRICLTQDLAFRSCREVDADGCRRRGLTLPAIP